MKKIKELTPSQSMKMVKDLLKSKKKFQEEDYKPGKILFYFYNAKDKEQTYDRTPLVMILKRNSSHTLGLNFHWIPIPMRVALIKHILAINKLNIKLEKPLNFDYSNLKPMLKKLGYAPCIRLYINNRISSNGVVIPNSMLFDIGTIKSETFTNGKYSAQELYQKAVRNVKHYKKTRKRRE